MYWDSTLSVILYLSISESNENSVFPTLLKTINAFLLQKYLKYATFKWKNRMKYRACSEHEWPFLIVHNKAFGTAISLLSAIIENIRYD